MAEIRVEQLHKAFADFVAVKDSTFTVKDGEFFCLLGPSGCGKTTTLRMIAGLELPTSGRIFLGNEDVTFKRASKRDIAFVFQLFALYPHLNVRRNIAFPLVSQGMLKSEIDAKVEEAARILRITHLLNRSVSGLASGDRQRVALGRAIVRQPLAFMMDEPLGALDSEFRELMCHELRGLHDRLKATTVYVTHDQMEAMAMADTIAIMNAGVIEQLGAPQDVYDRPASVFVADFIGAPSMNFIPFEGAYAAGAREVAIGAARIQVPAFAEGVTERALLCGVRPEHVRFDDASALRAEVVGTEYLGHSQIVTLTTAVGSTLRAKVGVQVQASRGDRVGLAFDASAVSLFDRPTGRALALQREPPMADLRLDRVSKRFGNVQAVAELSLEVASGEFIVLLGPSGAGKTTTLRLVAGLETPDQGRVHIGGHDVTATAPALRDVTFVFQQYSLYPHLSVFDNLAFPLRSPLRRIDEAKVRAKVTEVAKMLRIDDKLANPATKLSGGQMQRVAIGRALVRDPAVTLMDEPLSSLDAKLRNDLRLELKRIQQDLGATMLYVTHDQTEALTLATRIGVLDHGRLVQIGSPREVYENPQSSVVAARLGSPRINLVPRAALHALAAPAGAATAGVRAEHLQLHVDASAHGVRARVRRIEILSDQRLVHLALADSAHELISAAPARAAVEPGSEVRVEFDRPLWFDDAGRRIAG